jgi:uncharacterized protein YukE
MGSGFQIDLGQMRSLITTLTDAKESMTSADDALKNASAQDLGSAGLDSAGAGFAHKWGYGIGKIAHFAGQMTTGLRQTQQNYQDTEDEIANVFGGSDNGGGANAVGTGVAAAGSAISQRLSGGPR